MTRGYAPYLTQAHHGEVAEAVRVGEGRGFGAAAARRKCGKVADARPFVPQAVAFGHELVDAEITQPVGLAFDRRDA